MSNRRKWEAKIIARCFCGAQKCLSQRDAPATKGGDVLLVLKKLLILLDDGMSTLLHWRYHVGSALQPRQRAICFPLIVTAARRTWLLSSPIIAAQRSPVFSVRSALLRQQCCRGVCGCHRRQPMSRLVPSCARLARTQLNAPSQGTHRCNRVPVVRTISINGIQIAPSPNCRPETGHRAPRQQRSPFGVTGKQAFTDGRTGTRFH